MQTPSVAKPLPPGFSAQHNLPTTSNSPHSQILCHGSASLPFTPLSHLIPPRNQKRVQAMNRCRSRHSAAAAASLSLLAALASLAAADAGGSDPFCPMDMQYLVGFRCNPGSPVTLTCVPELLRGQLCSLPATGWARTQCLEQTGNANTPDLIEEVTGCYSISDGPWDEIGADVPQNATRDTICDSFPINVPEDFVESFENSESFEEANALDSWLIDTSADPEPELQVDIACEGDPADYYVAGYPDYGFAFTNLLSEAPDGSCAARIRGGCTVDYSVGGTNSLSRPFRVANRGCTPGLMAYDMTFSVAFDAREACEKYDYDVPFNDFAEIFVETGGREVLVKRFSICRDADSPGFQPVTVDLGEVPLGSMVMPVISVRVTNAIDCVFDSLVILDDIRITPRSGPAPPPTPVQNTQPLPPPPPAPPPPEDYEVGVVYYGPDYAIEVTRARQVRRARRVRRQRPGRAMPPR
eukprot:jgi/Ulvmu1/9408/UM051_0036.1